MLIRYFRDDSTEYTMLAWSSSVVVEYSKILLYAISELISCTNLLPELC